MFGFLAKLFWSAAAICFFISLGIVLAGMSDSALIGPVVQGLQEIGQAFVTWIRELWSRTVGNGLQAAFLAGSLGPWGLETRKIQRGAGK